MSVLPARVCRCIIFVPITHRGQRTILNPLELELQERIATWVLKTKLRFYARATSILSHRTIALPLLNL